MSVESPDMCTVKKCLEGAGLYEESMASDDMISFYNVLKSSETTASEEKQRRLRVEPKKEDLQEDDIKIEVKEESSTQKIQKGSFTPKAWSHQKRQLEASVSTPTISTPKKPKPTSQELRDKLSKIDICLSLPNKHNMNVTTSIPKYFGPYYCHKSIDNLPIKEKIKMISSYHLALASKLYTYQRKSIFLAEWGNPIYPTTKFNGQLDKTLDSPKNQPSDILESSPDEIYISRGGRQIKRKVYSDVNLSDEENNKKKSKTEVTPKPLRPAKKLLTTKKMSNEDIMSRSSLFAPDSPTVTKTRSEQLFENLKAEDVKKKKTEKEMEKFEATLTDFNEEDFELKITSSQIVKPQAPALCDTHQDELMSDGTKFVKKRIIPPVAGRKGYKRSQAIETVVEGSTARDNTQNKAIPLDDPKKATASPRNSKKKLTKCPICSEVFSQNEIEEHASTCGLTSELEIENNLPNQDVGTYNSVPCHICEDSFILSTNFEVHVNECIAKHNKK